MSAVEEFEAALAAHGCEPRGGQARCPAHEDQRPSLSYREGDTQPLVVHCHAGCSYDDILAALALDPAAVSSGKRGARRVVTRYAYLDEQGELLYEVLRYRPKSFAQVPASGKTGPGAMNGVRRVPYRLPEVAAAAQAGRQVWVVEGEKDADAIAAATFGSQVATCNSGGAGKWTDDHSARLVGAHVKVVRDKDEAGRKHAADVVASLRRAGVEVTGVYEAAEGNDIADHLAAGKTLVELVKVESDPTLTQEAASEDVELRPLADMLRDLERELRRYLIADEAVFVVLVLWLAHTHAFETSDCTPYLHLTSPERRCGKTLTLELLALLSARALSSANLTGPALFRTIELERPTLLIDEADNVFKGPRDSERKADILGVLNSGFRRSGSVVRLVGKTHKPQRFTTFCPKVIASIGGLPDTLADRCIALRLRRKLAHEKVERFRYRVAGPELTTLCEQLGAAVSEVSDELADAWPELPSALSDRQADAWEPLLAVADVAEGEWPKRARNAAIDLHRQGLETSGEELDILADIREVFDTFGEDQIDTKTLVLELNKLESADWVQYNNGRGLTGRSLALLLRPYGIEPGKSGSWRGYRRRQFEDAWRRYLDDPKAEA